MLDAIFHGEPENQFLRLPRAMRLNLLKTAFLWYNLILSRV